MVLYIGRAIPPTKILNLRPRVHRLLLFLHICLFDSSPLIHTISTSYSSTIVGTEGIRFAVYYSSSIHIFRYIPSRSDRRAFRGPLCLREHPSPTNMCDYTQVEFRCGHVRYTVRAWCTSYETTHKRCPPTVVAIEFR